MQQFKVERVKGKAYITLLGHFFDTFLIQFVQDESQVITFLGHFFLGQFFVTLERRFKWSTYVLTEEPTVWQPRGHFCWDTFLGTLFLHFIGHFLGQLMDTF